MRVAEGVEDLRWQWSKPSADRSIACHALTAAYRSRSHNPDRLPHNSGSLAWRRSGRATRRRLLVGYSCRCKPRHAEPPEFSTGLSVQSLVKRSIGASFFLLSYTISQSVSELSAHQNLIYESASESSGEESLNLAAPFRTWRRDGFRSNPAAPSTRDGARQRGLVNAPLDEGLINVDGHYFAPG